MSKGETMKLDRNKNELWPGKGKYALIKLREIPGFPKTPEELAEAIKENPSCVDYGIKGSDSEFFVIRLKDQNAAAALHAYAEQAYEYDEEWAKEVCDMACRAQYHAAKKIPD